MAKLYVNTVGCVITVSGLGDISDATTETLYVMRPDGVSDEWDGTLGTDDESITYTTLGTEIDLPGVYFIQPYIETPTWEGYCETVQLAVYDIDAPAPVVP
jgi:hypothetical protein